jgi:hypothetical protein
VGVGAIVAVGRLERGCDRDRIEAKVLSSDFSGVLSVITRGKRALACLRWLGEAQRSGSKAFMWSKLGSECVEGGISSECGGGQQDITVSGPLIIQGDYRRETA